MKTIQTKIVSAIHSRPVFIIYLMAIAAAVFMIFRIGPLYEYDTTSYLDAWTIIKSGSIDSFRTPVYPIFLGVLYDVFGERAYQIIAVCLQYTFFLLSVRPFYNLSRTITQKPILSFAAALIYATWPGIATWSNSLLTESFAIGGMVFLLHASYTYFSSPKVSFAFKLAFWMLFLVMLRPGFIYLFPIFLVFWMFLWFKRRGNSIVISGLLIIFIVGGIQAFYAHRFQQKYGYLAMSSVSDINRMANGFNFHWIKSEKILGNSIRADVEQFYSKLEMGIWEGDIKELFFDKYGCKIMHQELKNAFEVSSLEFVHSYTHVWNESSKVKPLCVSYTEKYSYLVSFVTAFGFGFGTINIVLLAYFIVLCIAFCKEQRLLPYLFSLFLFVLCFSHLFTIIFGAGDVNHTTRLFAPSMPIIILMISQIASMFTVRTDWIKSWRQDD